MKRFLRGLPKEYKDPVRHATTLILVIQEAKYVEDSLPLLNEKRGFWQRIIRSGRGFCGPTKREIRL